MQEPSEESFDINSVPKEVKTHPLVEKKAPGKKQIGLGAPPSGPPSTVDGYEKLLSSIPEFGNFGKLFKVRAPDSFLFFLNLMKFLMILFLTVLSTGGAY